MTKEKDRQFMNEAIREAMKSLEEGGIPIGAILVVDNKIVGRGHNRRVQKNSAILHAEMDCLENAGRLPAKRYKRAAIYSTLAPCDMCSGAILLYGIPRVVVGEDVNFQGPTEYLRSRGINVTIMQDSNCIDMMNRFIKESPSLWSEDIGE